MNVTLENEDALLMLGKGIEAAIEKAEKDLIASDQMITDCKQSPGNQEYFLKRQSVTLQAIKDLKAFRAAVTLEFWKVYTSDTAAAA